ncbi:hypothetical protein [uncultured Aquimarina sp.]|uniref:hypothetical protein n=1 Tax=uncultured Aquimarina sp. TaxID=575652 RepID=UPI00261A4219|nr:hypothetical protein [uncultured Aquimarina sp.]
MTDLITAIIVLSSFTTLFVLYKKLKNNWVGENPMKSKDKDFEATMGMLPPESGEDINKRIERDLRHQMLKRYTNQQRNAYVLYFTSIITLVVLVVLLLFYFLKETENVISTEHYASVVISLVLNGGFINFSKSLYNTASQNANKYILDTYNSNEQTEELKQ